MPTTVVIADDQAMVRAGFAALLDAADGISVLGDAPDGAVAVDVCKRLKPDVVLMDVRMPERDGLWAAQQIIDAGLPTRVLMLTTFDIDDYVYTALRIGASGFLLTDAPADELVRAVRVVAAGDSLLAPSVTKRLIAEVTSRQPRPAGDAADVLTPREREVLTVVADGKSNSEIAAQLFVSEETVKTHVSSVLNKLGLRDRAQAVVFAYENGLK